MSEGFQNWANKEILKLKEGQQHLQIQNTKILRRVTDRNQQLTNQKKELAELKAALAKLTVEN